MAKPQAQRPRLTARKSPTQPLRYRLLRLNGDLLASNVTPGDLLVTADRMAGEDLAVSDIGDGVALFNKAGEIVYRVVDARQMKRAA